MSATGRRCRKMQHLSTAFLIIALVIAVNGGVTGQDDMKADQIADESKNRAVTIIDGPVYVAPPTPIPSPTNQTRANQNQTRFELRPEPIPEPRPPSGPPHAGRPARPAPDNYRQEQRPHHSPVRHKSPPSRHRLSKPVKLRHPSSTVYRFPRVIPLPSHHRAHYHSKPHDRQQLLFAASDGRPVRITKPPKFSVPVETINGIRADVVRPPKILDRSTTSTSTSTTTSTTTQRPLRNKRIWPKGYLEKKISIPQRPISHNTTASNSSNTDNSTSTNSTDLEIASATHYRFKYVNTNRTVYTATTTFVPLTVTRGYRKVVRKPKHTTTVASDIDYNFTRIEPNEWVPIVPPYHPKKRRPVQTPMSRRSDSYFMSPDEIPEESKRTMYLQSYGLVPVPGRHAAATVGERKKMIIFRKKKRQLQNNMYSSGYSQRPSAYAYGDLQQDGSHHPRTITRIKHHHHHHHHRYIKTVEKPVNVPYKVEVPRPYPVPVEKKVPVAVEKIKIVEKPVPYPVEVEKRVPYPVQVAVPHPVPYKVIEKEYIPKPYPVVQHVPVLKHVEVKVPQPVPVTVEKRVPYPVEVQVPVPVDRPYPVTVEKRVPYPVPVKVLVPQPYPVETRVPYPVEVKVREPVEVVKHVPVRVPYPQPYPVKVPTPVAVPVEKRVPYPVEVEKKVPVPYKVLVPQKVEVEKKVPVYVPRPYPVETKVPVPVKVPYPVKVPVYTKVPEYLNSYLQQAYLQKYNEINRQVSGLNSVSEEVTSVPNHVVTVHGNTGFAGFQSRSDKTETTSAESSEKTETTSAESFEKTQTTSAESFEKTQTTAAESFEKTQTTSAESFNKTEESLNRTETLSSSESSDRINTSSVESPTNTQVSPSADAKGFETTTVVSTLTLTSTSNKIGS